MCLYGGAFRCPPLHCPPPHTPLRMSTHYRNTVLSTNKLVSMRFFTATATATATATTTPTKARHQRHYPAGLLGHEGRPCLPPISRVERERPPRRPCGGEVAGRATHRGHHANATTAAAGVKEAEGAAAAAPCPTSEPFPGQVREVCRRF